MASFAVHPVNPVNDPRVNNNNSPTRHRAVENHPAAELPQPAEVDPAQVRATAQAALTRRAARRGVRRASVWQDDTTETTETWDEETGELEHDGGDATPTAYVQYLRDALAAGGPNTDAQNFAAAKRGDRDALVTGNLLLVVSIALQRVGGYDEQRLLDVIQEGNRGLMRAAALYDPSRNVPFASYAYWQIKRFILEEAARQATDNVLPDAKALTLRRLHAARLRLEADHNRLYTLPEVATLLRIEEQNDHPTRQEAVSSRWPDAEEVVSWLATANPLYLSEVIHHGKPGDNYQIITLADTLPAPALRLDASFDDDELRVAGIIATSPRHTPCAPQRAQADLRNLRRAHLLTDEQVAALVLCYGLPHPSARWRAPDRWTIGVNHSIRWAAGVQGVGRETIRRRLKAAFTMLRAQAARRPSAARVLSVCAVPAPIVRRQRVTTLSRKVDVSHGL